jgi:hypothetical protein
MELIETLMVNMLLQARLDFAIYSIGIDFASLVVKIKKNLVVGDGVLPKVNRLNSIDSHKSMYYTVYIVK